LRISEERIGLLGWPGRQRRRRTAIELEWSIFDLECSSDFVEDW
jgi:hypothetical protein